MKTHINKPIRIFSAFLLFILFSNADCSMRDEPVCYISDEFKTYVIFHTGSYWIYQNQIGIIDTVTLIKTEQSIKDSPYSYPIESYEITKKSTIKGEIRYHARCEANRIGCSNTSSMVGGEFWPVLFFCCCEEGTRIENLTYVAEDSLNVNGEYYHQVRHFESDSIAPQSLKSLYYIEDIGLVRYEDFENDQWELIGYHIKQEK